MAALRPAQWRYPADWPQISFRAIERAWNLCEDCGAENFKTGGYAEGGRWLPARPRGERMGRLDWPRDGDWAWCGRPGATELTQLRVERTRLTVVPINGDPADVRPENLRAVCQRCRKLRERRRDRITSFRAEAAIRDMFTENGT